MFCQISVTSYLHADLSILASGGLADSGPPKLYLHDQAMRLEILSQVLRFCWQIFTKAADSTINIYQFKWER